MTFVVKGGEAMENEDGRETSRVNVQRKHKDRLFVNLFSYKENALSLFNAANDTNTDIDNLKETLIN